MITNFVGPMTPMVGLLMTQMVIARILFHSAQSTNLLRRLPKASSTALHCNQASRKPKAVLTHSRTSPNVSTQGTRPATLNAEHKALSPHSGGGGTMQHHRLQQSGLTTLHTVSRARPRGTFWRYVLVMPSLFRWSNAAAVYNLPAACYAADTSLNANPVTKQYECKSEILDC